MIFDRDVRQRDLLFHLGSLADVRQVQIVLRENGPAKSQDGEAKNKRLKRDCFHNVALPFSDFRLFATG